MTLCDIVDKKEKANASNIRRSVLDQQNNHDRSIYMKMELVNLPNNIN
jgi:hypothetical protein